MNFLRYALVRLVLFLLAMLALYTAGLRNALLLIAAFVLSGIVSFFLLRKQREAMNQRALERAEQRMQRKSGTTSTATNQGAAGPPDVSRYDGL